MKDHLKSILNSEIKIQIIRLLASHLEGYHATGREIARLVRTTAPTAHTALKELYAYHILTYEISGRNHLYSLNRDTRLVKDILLPMLQKENDFKNDVFRFIITSLKEKKAMKSIVSILFDGSQQKEKANGSSDIDIALIVRDNSDLEIMENLVIENITSSFYAYFGVSLDPYIKTQKGSIDR